MRGGQQWPSLHIGGKMEEPKHVLFQKAADLSFVCAEVMAAAKKCLDELHRFEEELRAEKDK